ncbi:MAG: hypothetical protein AAB506_03075 [Patescibacteria group bacterium]
MSGTAKKIERVIKLAPEKRGDTGHPLPKVLKEKSALEAYIARLLQQRTKSTGGQWSETILPNGQRGLAQIAEARRQKIISF